MDSNRYKSKPLINDEIWTHVSAIPLNYQSIPFGPTIAYIRLIWSWCPSRCVALLQNKMYSCTTSPEACFFLNDSFITKWILFPSKRNRHLLRLNRCPINQSLDKYLVATERMSLIQIDRLDSLQASKSECFVAATRFGSTFCPRWLWRSSISAGCQNDSDKKHSSCDLGTQFTGLDVWKTSMVFCSTI